MNKKPVAQGSDIPNKTEEPDTNKLKQMLERDRTLRGEQALKEINAILEKYRCKLSSRRVEVDGQIIEAGIVVTPLE